MKRENTEIKESRKEIIRTFEKYYYYCGNVLSIWDNKLKRLKNNSENNEEKIRIVEKEYSKKSGYFNIIKDLYKKVQNDDIKYVRTTKYDYKLNKEIIYERLSFNGTEYTYDMEDDLLGIGTMYYKDEEIHM